MVPICSANHRTKLPRPVILKFNTNFCLNQMSLTLDTGVAEQLPLFDHSYESVLFDNFESQKSMLDLGPGVHAHQQFPDAAQSIKTIYDQPFSFSPKQVSTGFQPLDISGRR